MVGRYSSRVCFPRIGPQGYVHKQMTSSHNESYVEIGPSLNTFEHKRVPKPLVVARINRTWIIVPSIKRQNGAEGS